MDGQKTMNEKDLVTDRKALFATAVEDALNDMGPPTLEIINNKLFQEYRCTIPDCLEHPEYLKNALKQVFGYADMVVIAKIKRNLGDFTLEEPVGEFVKVLSK